MTDWDLSPHARKQMAERAVTTDELLALLARPVRTSPDPKGKPGCRVYQGYGLLAVVNEDRRRVITVMLDGSSKKDWEADARARRSLAAAPAPAPEIAEAPRSRSQRGRGASASGPVVSSVPQLHPAVRAGVEDALRQQGLNWSHVRVVSPTRAVIQDPEKE